jgi:threonine/homoserine/homoserine lactone efflux protein
MIDLVFIFFSSIVIALSGAMMPGPLLTATISESSTRGAIAGPLLIVGHGLLEIVLVFILLLGLAPFLQMKEVFAFVAFGGSGVLCWMAIGMFRSVSSLTLKTNRTAKYSGRILLSGAVLSLANPYWSIWWATIGLGYLIKSKSLGIAGIGTFMAGHLLGDIAWYTAISTAISKGRRLFTDRVYRTIIAGCAALLVVFALYFLYTGFKVLFQG